MLSPKERHWFDGEMSMEKMLALLSSLWTCNSELGFWSEKPSSRLVFDYVEYGQGWLGECRHVHQLHLPVGGQHHQAGGHGGQEGRGLLMGDTGAGVRGFNGLYISLPKNIDKLFALRIDTERATIDSLWRIVASCVIG